MGRGVVYQKSAAQRRQECVVSIIVAERTWVETPEEIEALRQAHRDFVAASSHRRAVFAEGSGHHVMRDRPDVVLDAVAQLVAAVRGAEPWMGRDEGA